VSSKTIIGSTVKNTQGEELGEIEELMIDPRTRNIKEAVLSLGGGWVTEAKQVTLPWETLKVGLGVKEFTVKMDKAQLQNVPSVEITPESAPVDNH
jgi:sporulation protein YlmC with PRC-barrel domain